MEVLYAKKKIERICNNLNEAQKYFGGDRLLALSLLARVNALESAVNLHEIIIQRNFHFHNLHDKGRSKFEGFHAIDVKTRKEPWRVILQALDEAGEPYVNRSIDEIAAHVVKVRITEVSKHYE